MLRPQETAPSARCPPPTHLQSSPAPALAVPSASSSAFRRTTSRRAPDTPGVQPLASPQRGSGCRLERRGPASGWEVSNEPGLVGQAHAQVMESLCQLTHYFDYVLYRVPQLHQLPSVYAHSNCAQPSRYDVRDVVGRITYRDVAHSVQIKTVR